MYPVTLPAENITDNIKQTTINAIMDIFERVNGWWFMNFVKFVCLNRLSSL